MQTYLGHYQTLMRDVFYEQLLAIQYFRKKAPSQFFDRILYTPPRLYESNFVHHFKCKETS